MSGPKTPRSRRRVLAVPTRSPRTSRSHPAPCRFDVHKNSIAWMHVYTKHSVRGALIADATVCQRYCALTKERRPPQLANGRTPSKKTVMRRSLPPVGVKIVLDEDFRRIQAEDQRMAFEIAITHDFAETLGAAPERFRIMRIEAGSVVVFINVIASPDDEDARSPMQLAAELVMMAKRENSALRQRKTLRNVREADIVEEPFASSRQDTWAGGVATMQSSGNMAEQAQAFFAQTGASPAPMPTRQAAAQARVAAPLASPPRPAAVLKAKNTAELPGGTIPIEGGTYAGELDEGRRNGRGRQAAPSRPLLPCAS